MMMVAHRTVLSRMALYAQQHQTPILSQVVQTNFVEMVLKMRIKPVIMAKAKMMDARMIAWQSVADGNVMAKMGVRQSVAKSVEMLSEPKANYAIMEINLAV